MSSVSRPPRRIKRASAPFGAEVAALLKGASPRDVLEPVLGAERTAALLDHATCAVLRERGATSTDAVHADDAPHLRRVGALLLMILGEVSVRGRAWTGRLFRGHTRRLEDDGTVVHCPGKSAGGLAARLGVCPRTVDRYLAVLKAARVLEVWQGPKDAPAKFRGREYAYAVYQWVGELPRAVAERLASWWRRATAKAPPAPPPERPYAPRDRAPGGTPAHAFLARLGLT